jgi:hypothetical protein
MYFADMSSLDYFAGCASGFLCILRPPKNEFSDEA